MEIHYAERYNQSTETFKKGDAFPEKWWRCKLNGKLSTIGKIEFDVDCFTVMVDDALHIHAIEDQSNGEAILNVNWFNDVNLTVNQTTKIYSSDHVLRLEWKDSGI